MGKNKKPELIVTPLMWFTSLTALLVWSVALGMASLYISTINYGIEMFRSYFEKPIILTLNVLPVFLFTLTVFVATNRVWSASLVSSVFVIAPTVINYFKILFRTDPFIAKDIQYALEAADIGQRYAIFMTVGMKLTIIGAAIFTLLSVFLFRARFKGENGQRARIVILCVIAISWLVGWNKYYDNEEVYKETENIDVELPGRVLSGWSDSDQFVSRGFVYPFLMSFRDLQDTKPEGYSPALAEKILNAYDYDDIPEDEKVNVIAIMLEAFCDLTDFNKFEYAVDPYVILRKLQDEGVHGNLITNIFAGDTVNTERGFVTGSTEHYDYRVPADSYVRYFREQGYYTEFCHPGSYWFYNRRNVADYLGFHASWYDVDRYPPVREDWVIGDSIFLPDIITLFEESIARGEKYFNFSVTYQGHGPYATDRLYASDEFVLNYGMSLISYNVINNYLSSVADTLVNVEKFVDYFREQDEPVIILLFGDHKPWLGDNSAVYYELDFDINRSTPTGFFNFYSTPYIIWANDSAKDALDADFTGYGGDFSPAFLMTKLFDLAGWGGNEYMKLTRDVMRYVDVIHSPTGLVRESGEYTDSPTQDAADILKNFDVVQYFRRTDMQFK